MERSSLSSSHPRSLSALVTVSILANIGLLIFSDVGVGAQVMYSTAQWVDASTPPSNSSDGCRAEGALQNTSVGDIAAIVSTCVLPCFSQWPGVCFGECVRRNTGFSDNCTACFDSSSTCIVSNCLLSCLGGVTAGCMACSDANCMEEFISCSSIPPPYDSVHQGRVLDNRSRSDTEGGIYLKVPPSVAYRPLGPDGDITYVSALRSAWQARAYLVASLILACSGVWPYLSNVLFATAWFVPLTPRGRGQLLQWTNRLDRWALMDVMVVCVTIALFEVTVAGVHVVSEARAAICTFAVAGVHSIVQGMWIAARDQRWSQRSLPPAEARELATVDAAHLGCGGGRRAAPLERLFHAEPRLRPLWALASAASLALMAAAASLPVMHKEESTAGAEATRTSYTILSLGGRLHDPSHEGATDPSSAFLALAYSAVGLGASMLAVGLLALASAGWWLAPTSPLTARLVVIANWVTPFAVYDVLVVALLVTVREYHRIVDATIFSIAGDTASASSPLRVHAYAGTGAWLLLASSILTWVGSFFAACVGRALAATQVAIEVELKQDKPTA